MLLVILERLLPADYYTDGPATRLAPLFFSTSPRVSTSALLVVSSHRLLAFLPLLPLTRAGLTGVQIDSLVLIDLLKVRLPSLHAHFDAIGVLPILPIVTTQWFIGLSRTETRTHRQRVPLAPLAQIGRRLTARASPLGRYTFWLPSETLMRVWDCFFFEGLKNKCAYLASPHARAPASGGTERSRGGALPPRG